MIENTILQQKLQTLAAFPNTRQEVVRQFGDILAHLSDRDLIRINPIRFAQEHHLEETETINLFIYGAKIGLFDFEWNLICPSCGAIMKSHPSIGSVEREIIHCAVCDLDLEVDLSTCVEVAFSINPEVKPLHLTPFADYDSYRAYFFSNNMQTPPALTEYIQQNFRGFYALEPDTSVKIPCTLQSGDFYRLTSPDYNMILRVKGTEHTAELPQIVDIDLVANGFVPENVSLPAGTVTLNITSHLPQTAGLCLHQMDYEQIADLFTNIIPRFQPLLTEKPVVSSQTIQSLNTLAPFLTGKILLNNQLFRDLFRIQTLPRDLQLKVGNTTILFTDLKGSTALYEKTGDMTAYNLVQKHFEILKASTSKYSGAIIKTIGDAIMASFSTPTDGILSALDMIEQVHQMNWSGKTHGEDISVKIGLNAGTALAVTANEMLDYFGQCVNLAARVQGLADGGEIWLTDTMYTDATRQVLQAAHYQIEKQSAQLKGISTPTTVYRCYQ